MFPAVSFSTLILSLASTALVGMGEAPDPITGKVYTDLSLAQHNIDILDLLQQKTKGNLTSEENALLGNLLCDLRLKYVMRSDRQ